MIYLLSLRKGLRISIFLLMMLVSATAKNQKMNVLLIICDDLNDYIEGFGGHPQARTPNIKRLMESGISFLDAHCNIPICNPSRASFATGIYPHNSGHFGFEPWNENEVLKNSHTMMTFFASHGYQTLGTGKVMHNHDKGEWQEYGHPSDYGPFLFDGIEKLPHLGTPSPFRDDFGIIDGTFGPLEKVSHKVSSKTGQAYSWRTGGWRQQRPMKYETDSNRDPTGDELNAQWATRRLRELASSKNSKPFFMGVGFVRPHTPLIVPQKYFDLSPIRVVGNVTTPTLVMVGEEDWRTPAWEAEQWYTALKMQGVPAAYVRVPGASHSIAARPSNMAAKVDTIMAWFARFDPQH